MIDNHSCSGLCVVIAAAEVPFLGSVGHQGFVKAAESLLDLTLPTLLAAAKNPKYADWTLVVTGHSLGGCTAQTLVLLLRHTGKRLAGTVDADGDIEARAAQLLIRARCMAFAAAAVAAPELQQSPESLELSVSVIYGYDMIPRLGKKFVSFFRQSIQMIIRFVN